MPLRLRERSFLEAAEWLYQHFELTQGKLKKDLTHLSCAGSSTRACPCASESTTSWKLQSGCIAPPGSRCWVNPPCQIWHALLIPSAAGLYTVSALHYMTHLLHMTGPDLAALHVMLFKSSPNCIAKGLRAIACSDHQHKCMSDPADVISGARRLSLKPASKPLSADDKLGVFALCRPNFVKQVMHVQTKVHQLHGTLHSQKLTPACLWSCRCDLWCRGPELESWQQAPQSRRQAGGCCTQQA